MSRFAIVEAEQRSPEWFAARLGKLTGSRAGGMLATIKTGEAAAKRDLRMQLVCERLTGRPQEDGYTNDVMRRGVELEPAARGAYEAETGQIVQATGFIALQGMMAGCSLDGHVGDFDGIVELKCPKSATHLRYIQSQAVPREHLPQMRHNLWVTGAAWCDFVSFDDRFPEDLQFFRARLLRDEADIDGYAALAEAFLAEVDAAVQGVERLRKAVA